MPGYLDQYGAGDERREKTIKALVIALAAIIVVGGALWFIFHNYRQERQAKHFFSLLEAGDYPSAYALWVRTDQDKLGYPMQAFLQDWGPKGQHADVAAARIVKSRSCGSGVILTVDFGGKQQEKLWVERDDLTLGFSPLPGCPAPR